MLVLSRIFPQAQAALDERVRFFHAQLLPQAFNLGLRRIQFGLGNQHGRDSRLRLSRFLVRALRRLPAGRQRPHAVHRRVVGQRHRPEGGHVSVVLVGPEDDGREVAVLAGAQQLRGPLGPGHVGGPQAIVAHVQAADPAGGWPQPVRPRVEPVEGLVLVVDRELAPHLLEPAPRGLRVRGREDEALAGHRPLDRHVAERDQQELADRLALRAR